MNYNERVEFYINIYYLVIKYDFVSTDESFNNRTVNKSKFIEPNPKQSSFASFHPALPSSHAGYAAPIHSSLNSLCPRQLFFFLFLYPSWHPPFSTKARPLQKTHRSGRWDELASFIISPHSPYLFLFSPCLLNFSPSKQKMQPLFCLFIIFRRDSTHFTFGS